MADYNFKKIEQNWKEKWFDNNIYEAVDFSEKPKKYILAEWPYPSGKMIHIGHAMRYTVPEVYSRYLRMKGYNVMFPMGWDAFGLPTEGHALKENKSPQKVTIELAKNYKKAMQDMGYAIDWERETNSTDPEYYKWTQWLFLKFYEHGLAKFKEMPVWWCKELGNLADEEIITDEDGNKVSERGGHKVERRPFGQWVLKIPKYAEKLLAGLDDVNFPNHIKVAQRHWIGKSEGAEIDFEVAVENNETENAKALSPIKVFTTRLDTIYGAAFIALAPEHPVLEKLSLNAKNKPKVEKYVEKAKNMGDLERQTLKEKTGIKLEGVYAVHPFTAEKLPIFVTNYIIMTYGTGAVMGVPAHDARDNEFAQSKGLDIKTVIEPVTGEKSENEEFRRSIVALVHNPKTNKILSINWGEKLGGNLLVGGGLAEKEDPVECAIREIAEETGYTNVKHITTSETIHHHYFAHSKNVARQIDATGLYFELVDETQDSTNLEDDEKDKFAVEWLTKEEAESKIQDPLHKYVFDKFILKKVYVDYGILVNSGEFSELSSEKAIKLMNEKLEKEGRGSAKITYKIRDWVFSRQHYWGEPIPLIYKENGEVEAIVNSENLNEIHEKLPLELPYSKDYSPGEDGSAPLAKLTDWVKTTDSEGGEATRETQTMPTWAGSSWYYLRYIDPENTEAFADMDKLKYWLPVDQYFGGAEHTTVHLLYSRFWHQFFYDIGIVPTKEPYQWRINGGLLLAADGKKMSKRLGNIVEPGELIEQYGADATRMAICFIGPYTDTYPWNEGCLKATARLLGGIWGMRERVSEGVKMSAEVVKSYHKMVKKVGEMYEDLKMNTAVSEIMIFVNGLKGIEKIDKEVWTGFVRVLAPMAPFLSEELWQESVGSEWTKGTSVHLQEWPKFDEKLARDEVVMIPVQVNGKVRDEIEVAVNAAEDVVRGLVFKSEKVAKYVDESSVKRFVYVPGRVVSLVV